VIPDVPYTTVTGTASALLLGIGPATSGMIATQVVAYDDVDLDFAP
jgi:hypothetical protein